MGEPKRFHLNVVGPFYVEDGNCIACSAPEHEAPTLMAHAEPDYHCYFKRQPETPEELTQAIDAVRVSCCEAVRYGGADPEILGRIEQPWGRGTKIDERAPVAATPSRTSVFAVRDVLAALAWAVLAPSVLGVVIGVVRGDGPRTVALGVLATLAFVVLMVERRLPRRSK